RGAAPPSLAQAIKVQAGNRFLGEEAGRELGKREIAGMGEPAQAKVIIVIAEKVTANGGRPVELIRQCDELGTAVFIGFPRIGKPVSGTSNEAGEDLIKCRRVRNLILTERGECDILFQDRGQARPVGIAMAKDELVVGHAQEKLDQGLLEFVEKLIHVKTSP